MAKLKWDTTGEHFYETGVEYGVLYIYDDTLKKYGEGVAWNGLTGVTESPSGAETTSLYADNKKYLNLISKEEFSATIEAYTSPAEFDSCDGTVLLNGAVRIGQQSRKTFGLSYITKIGNDVVGEDYSEKIHIIYGAKASPSERSYATTNDSPEAMTLSWSISTTPIAVTGYADVSTMTISKEEAYKSDTGKAAYELLKATLHGRDASSGDTSVTELTATLPSPDEIIAMFEGAEG